MKINQLWHFSIFHRLLHNSTIGLTLLMAAVCPLNLSAASGTITFTSAPGGSTAHDGSGGSTDISGINLDIYFADQNRTLINNPLTFEEPYGAGTADSGLAVNYLTSEGSHYVIIKSSDTAKNFWLQSLQLSDYGGNNVKIEAFDNGVSKGSVNVAVNLDPWYFTFGQSTLTSSIFNNADEIRINGQNGGVIWLVINDIQIADAVVPNSPPTDIALSKTTVNQSAGTNATVGTLSSTDADSSSFTYSLTSGTGSTDNNLFNLSGSTLRANNASTLAAGNYSVRIQTDDGVGGTFSKAFSITVVDDVAPSAPTLFSADAAGNSVSLSWQNPASDFSSVTIRRSNTSYPATITEGTLVAQGLVGTSQTDDELTDGTYYYSIFALDAAGNVSVPATVSATVDNTAPTISIGSPSVAVTSQGPVDFVITYSGADSISLSANDITLNKTSTADGTIEITGSDGSRTVTISGITGSGTLSISIAANTASDLAGNSAAAAGPSESFTVNSAPTVATDNEAIAIGEGNSATNTGTFSDLEGNATATLTASIGSITQDNENGVWSWTFNSADDSQNVTILIEDGLSTNSVTFAVTVTNVAPAAISQSIITPEDIATNITLTAIDPGADSITNWVITVGPTNGTLSGVAPNLVYTPATNFNGSDSFQFTATDSDGAESAAATIDILVTAENDAPLAGPDNIARPDRTRTAKITKSALLANDTDPDGDTLTITAVGNATPPGATVVMAGAFIVYTAPSTNAGDGSFSYTLSDGSGGHNVTNLVPVVEVASVPSPGSPNYSAITPSGSDFVLTFIGVPGHTYRVQYTTSLSAPYVWNEFSPLAIYTAPTNGVFTHLDVNPPEPMRLYRAVPHP
ncbi:MAG TPA: Ig-like domain-containing protein [Verrucomicrobiae bacterium]|nr:Ig-like domain-containing protein [Verrucomicrobiae bacterium]